MTTGSEMNADTFLSAVMPLSIVLLILMIICAFRESKLTGLYRGLGIFGRIKAYLVADGAVGLIASVVYLVLLRSIIVVPMILISLVLLLVPYRLSLKKCPKEISPSALLRDMIIVGLGVGCKLAFFFLAFLWKVDNSLYDNYTNKYGYGRKIVTYTGEGLYIGADHRVYDESGREVGVAHRDGNGETWIEMADGSGTVYDSDQFRFF